MMYLDNRRTVAKTTGKLYVRPLANIHSLPHNISEKHQSLELLFFTTTEEQLKPREDNERA